MADFLEEQKKQSLFQNLEQQKTEEQGQISVQAQSLATMQSPYVSETEKTKDKAFFSVDQRAEELISGVKSKALTPSQQKDILNEDRKFRTRAGIRL